jgi:hypothetical protein
MPGIDKTTGRTVALIALLILAAAALRGYLPGAERAPREQPTDSPASLFAVIALLSVSTVIVAISIIARLRSRRPGAHPGALPDRLSRSGGLGRWRLLLIGLGVVVAWLLIVLLLSRLVPPQVVGAPPPATGTSNATRSDGQAPPPQPAPRQAGGDVFAYFAATTVTLVVLLAAGTIVASRRQRRVATPDLIADHGAEPPTAGGPESLARAAELGLAEIGDLSREPREAIIACYAAMESALANAPGAVPQDSDTPSEVLARAVEHHALRADNARQLVDLFAEARFSPHVMNEGHRDVAVRVLRLVLEEVRSVA